jgi:hypothetical protein
MRLIRAFARRLLRIYRKATEAARKAGSEWYRKARVTAYEMATRHGHSLSTSAGVIAALSPRLSWTYNVRAADLVLSGAERVPGVFAASLRKARAIAAGARPDVVLSGPKVRAFYRALTGDETAAVVDVWVSRAAGIGAASLSPKAYADVASALAIAAREAGTSTARLQAAVWVAVRGRA